MKYRDRMELIRDIIAKLIEYGHLNQTALISFVGLNKRQHKPLIDQLERLGLITGSRDIGGRGHGHTTTVYRPTQDGVKLCNDLTKCFDRLVEVEEPIYQLSRTDLSTGSVTQRL
jgi:predicted transcriptional regulator